MTPDTRDDRRYRDAAGRRLDADRRYRLYAALVSVLAGVAVYAVSAEVFPHLSTNHDEAVYLQQAELLLAGQLSLHPPVVEPFRPWFFVRDGGRLYPKYSPVPAAAFALGKLLGGYRLALAGVAACNAALTYAVTAEAFDRRTGVLAAVLLLGSPLFLVDSALFLSYAPTTALNLLFAFAYLRADRLAARDGSGRPAGGETEPAGPLAVVRSPAGGYAALAGAAVGLAFFARPYTAVLFAAPFLVHALWTLRPDGRRGEAATGGLRGRLDARALARQSVTAGLGLAGVGLTLGYNALVTGDPLLFPYQAFAPLDGLGFGYRRILGYDRYYTPALALRANAEVLARLFGRWVVAGPLGTVLALVGLAAWIRGAGRTGGEGEADRTDDGEGDADRAGDGEGGAAGDSDEEREAGRAAGGRLAWIPRPDPRPALLAGLFVSMIAGNVYFWGNLNLLGELSVADDGLVHLYGPYYHFDLLVPTAAFGARGALALADRWRAWVARRTGADGGPAGGGSDRDRVPDPAGAATGSPDPTPTATTDGGSGEGATLGAATGGAAGRARAVALAGLLVGAAVLASVGGAALDRPLSENARASAQLDAAYAPVENRTPENALVFLRTPYGDWLNHPFQRLRNDPGYDGRAVYALATREFAVIDAFPDRRLYRYSFRGEWLPTRGRPVDPRLRRIDHVRGRHLTVDAGLGIPDRTERVSVRVATGAESVRYATEGVADGGRLDLSLSLSAPNDTARVGGPLAAARPGESVDRTVRLATGADHRATLRVSVFLDYGAGAGVTYRLRIPVAREDGELRALTPYAEVCRIADRCGEEAAYVPGAVPEGLSLATDVAAGPPPDAHRTADGTDGNA